jgi:hypothetical protein
MRFPVMTIPNFRISPALFALGLLCFLFPFVTVSCQGQKIVRLTGVELVTGTTVKTPALFGPAQEKKTDASPLAGIAALAALGGLTLTLTKGAKTLLGGAVCGAVGACSLFLFKVTNSQASGSEMPGIVLSYDAGFYLAALFLASAAIWTFYCQHLLSTQSRGGYLPPQYRASTTTGG